MSEGFWGKWAIPPVRNVGCLPGTKAIYISVRQIHISGRSCVFSGRGAVKRHLAKKFSSARLKNGKSWSEVLRDATARRERKDAFVLLQTFHSLWKLHNWSGVLYILTFPKVRSWGHIFGHILVTVWSQFGPATSANYIFLSAEACSPPATHQRGSAKIGTNTSGRKNWHKWNPADASCCPLPAPAWGWHRSTGGGRGGGRLPLGLSVCFVTASEVSMGCSPAPIANPPWCRLTWTSCDLQ